MSADIDDEEYWKELEAEYNKSHRDSTVRRDSFIAKANLDEEHKSPPSSRFAQLQVLHVQQRVNKELQYDYPSIPHLIAAVDDMAVWMNENCQATTLYFWHQSQTWRDT